MTGKPLNNAQRALALLKKALAWSRVHGSPRRVKRLRAGINALTPKASKPPVPDPSFPAIAAARKQSHDGPQFGEGECLMRVRMCYGVAARDGDAITAWRNAVHKHAETNPARIPRGYPVFFAGGDHGHVAISAGDGMCWSSDSNRIGFFDFVPIEQPITQWGKTLLGWTEDINGVNLTISN